MKFGILSRNLAIRELAGLGSSIDGRLVVWSTFFRNLFGFFYLMSPLGSRVLNVANKFGEVMNVLFRLSNLLPSHAVCISAVSELVSPICKTKYKYKLHF